MVAINEKPVCLQFDTASDFSIISKRTWQGTGRPPTITSDKKAMDVSADSSGSRGTCYLTNRPKPDLIGLDWIEKLGLLDLPLNRFCNGAQSTWPNPAKSNQLTANLMLSIF
ncbi:unnamed protein product [Dibothriocephalus latus]|uniref:Peptidase A2 domain-containing protein n=1 Tax=Dibothriocephalus latus TaxID=60516 RepID=A0A3P7NLZ2_DIBLA|nr:unnamed protein product [Dibothriocephalus latus]